MSAITKDFKHASFVIPTKSLFTLFLCLVQKAGGCGRKPMSYHKPDQVATAIAAAILDVVSLLEQMNTFPCSW